ncbi:50S ribosomal protein L1 [bacterium F11]|nr:50S ribosomal protein L1 [bacterium F11]
MVKVTKRRKTILENIDRSKRWGLSEAVDVVKKNATAKFDESVEIHIHLGIDPKKTDQQVRGTTVLPKGLGKTKMVAVVAKGEKVKEAEAAGADFIGDSDIIEKIQKGWFGFDVLVATPDVMKDLSKLGKVLGPKGLMPNPKAGTVTFDIGRTVKELKSGRIEFKTDDSGNLHAAVGKVSFETGALSENIQAVLHAVLNAKPSTAKGTYIRSVTLTSTMGAGVRLAHETVV